MSTVNLEENPFILDYKKKAVFLHNLLSSLPGTQNQANREAIMHFAQNLSSNIQSYDDFVAAVTRSYQGPQLSEAGSKFNANTILNAIPQANATTKEITAENLNAAYDKTRMFFAADTHVTPITNAAIEEEKPKYLDFDKYKQDYLTRVQQLVTFNMPLQSLSLTGLAPDFVKEAQTGLDGITDYNQWTDKFNEQLMTAIKQSNPDNLLGYLTQEQLTIQSSLPYAQNMAYYASLTTTPPHQPEVQQQPEQHPEQSAHQEPQQPQYDSYSPNTKDHEERVKKWMEHIGLGDKAQDIINKYGVELAHKIVQTALMNPSDLTSATDGKWKSSKKTIEYFVNNDISEDKLATIPGVDADFVAQSLASRPRADKRLEIPEELQSHTPTYNIPTIDPTTITINPLVEQHDPRALYIANLKTQLKIDGFSQEEISQAIDKALQSTLEKGVKNDFALGTASQWCGTLRHEMFNALGVHNDLDRPYDYVGKLEQQAHASSLRGNIAKTPHFTEALNLAEATITQHETPSVELSKEPEVLTAENPIEPTIEPVVEPVVETERPEIVATTIDQRVTSGVDEPIVIPEIPGKTWEEIVATTTPKPPANFEEFKKAAWQEFTSSEGAILEPYFDCNGHPSIGIGQLIYKRNEIRQSGTCIAGTSLADKQDEIATATTIINDKNAYYMKNGKKVSLYSSAKDSTPNITSISGTVTIYDSKGNTVELERIPTAGAKIKKVNNVAIGKISKKESDKMFENRLRADYNRVCKAIPNFKDMPTYVQITAVHMCFGKTSTFCPPTKGVNDYTERSGFKYGEKRTPEELMGYVNKYYKKRGQVNDAIKHDLALANQEVAHINDQLALQNTIDNPSNQQTLLAQNQQQTTTDNSVHILNKLQSGRYS